MKYLLILWLLLLFFLFFQIYSYIKYRHFLTKLEKTNLSDEILNILNSFPEYSYLTPQQKQIIHFKLQRFIHEKQFIPIKIDLTEKMKYTVTFYACLPSIAYKYFCYPNLRYIYIYPRTVVINNIQNSEGIISEDTTLISGEAVGESVVLVWDEIKKEISHNLGRNVIIHEFAHELDFEEGMINGIPPISKSQYKEWTKIMFYEYNTFKHKLLQNRFLGKYSFLDKYAATNKAEFFAVMSEYYFSNPYILKQHFPDIYNELKKFYKIEINISN
jgi:hypothetical protein